jgi:hypothetical protein
VVILLLNHGKFNDDQIITSEHIADVIKPSPQFKGYRMLWWLDSQNKFQLLIIRLSVNLKR